MSNTTNTESFAQLFEESLAKQEMRQGEVITAEVLRVEHNFTLTHFLLSEVRSLCAHRRIQGRPR